MSTQINNKQKLIHKRIIEDMKLFLLIAKVETEPDQTRVPIKVINHFPPRAHNVNEVTLTLTTKEWKSYDNDKSEDKMVFKKEKLESINKKKDVPIHYYYNIPSSQIVMDYIKWNFGVHWDINNFIQERQPDKKKLAEEINTLKDKQEKANQGRRRFMLEEEPKIIKAPADFF